MTMILVELGYADLSGTGKIFFYELHLTWFGPGIVKFVIIF